MNDVVILKENGLLRAGANEDRTTCLVCGGIAIVDGAQLNTLTGPFYGIEDAEAVGITAAFDTDNDVLIHHHISEFFRGYGESTTNRPAKPLYLYMVSQSTPLSVMCDKDADYGAYKAAVLSTGKIRRFMMVLNPEDGYVPDTDDNGFDADVLEAIEKAQECADALYDLHMPVHFFVEGRDFTIDIAADALNLTTLDSESVTLVIVQDIDVARSNALHNGYAAVGTIAGLKSSKVTVADSFAEVGLKYEGNIQDKANDKFLKYGFGNNELADWNNITLIGLYSRGYVFPRVFTGVAGVFINQSFTCALPTSDFIREELNDTHNKAHRGIYAAYVPYINKKFKLTPAGKIPANVAKDLEDVGNAVFDAMENASEISRGRTYIDPNQAIATTRKILVKWRMVQMGKSEEIEGTLSFVVGIE